MILTCPNCGTQYVVKDGTVPPQGRQVRCAACKHSWHQDPEPEQGADEADPPVAFVAPEPAEPSTDEAAAASQEVDYDDVESDEPPAAEDQGEESIAEATLIEPRGGPEAEQRAYEEAVIAQEAIQPADEAVSTDAPVPAPADEELDSFEPAPGSEPDSPNVTERLTGAASTATTDSYREDEFSPFAERDVAEPRRRSPLVTILLLVVAIAALAAAFWFLAPAEWKARVGLSDPSKTPLELMITHPDRQKLASGQESLTITGRVINPTDATHSIPPIYAQLKSRTGQVIYSWTIAPPAPSLGPRASAPFNSTEVSVPSGGDDLTISLGAPKG